MRFSSLCCALVAALGTPCLRIPYELIDKSRDAHELRVRSGGFPCQHGLHRIWVRPHAMSTYLSSQVLD